MKRIVISLAVVAATPSAHALDLEGEMYVVGSVGRLSISQAAIDTSLNGSSTTSNGETTTLTSLQSNRETSRTGYKLQLGYEFSPNFAIEGGFVDLGKTTDSATYATTVSGSVSIWPFGTINYSNAGPSGSVTRIKNISGWNIAGVGIFPVNDSLSLFAKLGLIDAKVKYSASGSGPFSSVFAASDTTESHWKGYYGIGATYYPNNDHDLGVRVEYEKFSKIGDLNASGSTDLNLMSLGVSSRF